MAKKRVEDAAGDLEAERKKLPRVCEVRDQVLFYTQRSEI